ncbi:hypothetical protein HYQ45_005053 [Verticillium longisporum]|uniref:Uncharacterized protein n=1 Tax=Verticillium longisporum TaxID=100787 RepID=A0A8I2ZV10_VERLO|nr:hypothetical protein HYQ45_005053 [Verticillium longisporum]
MQVMASIRTTYKQLLDCTEPAKRLGKSCSDQVARFCDRVEAFESILQIQCRRIDSLIERLVDTKDLHEAILQYRDLVVNRNIALSTHLSALRVETVTEDMHEIAKRTEMDTSSMNTITFFTLIFLPVTFLGTFFGTPIFGGAKREGDESHESTQ